MALSGGLISLILGIIGLIVWWGSFVDLLMGAVPAILILGGALAAYLGVEELKDKRSAENFDTEKDELKQEVESLKEEIKGMKEKDTSEETD